MIINVVIIGILNYSCCNLNFFLSTNAYFNILDILQLLYILNMYYMCFNFSGMEKNVAQCRQLIKLGIFLQLITMN